MKFDSEPKNKIENHAEKNKKTSALYLLGVESMVKLYTNKVEVFGHENLTSIPKNKKVIIAASHISDLDMPLTIKALGKDFDIKVTGQSTNTETSAGKLSAAIAGSSRYIPIDYKIKDGEKKAGFNPENFPPMVSALEGGNAVLVAAHNPSWGELPHAGLGAIYLNQLGDDFVILPVTVNVKSSEPFQDGKNRIKIALERPDAEVFIGKPLYFDRITNISEYRRITEKRKQGELLTDEEIKIFTSISKTLREQSDILMHSIASALPEEKRGTYK